MSTSTGLLSQLLAAESNSANNNSKSYGYNMYYSPNELDKIHVGFLHIHKRLPKDFADKLTKVLELSGLIEVVEVSTEAREVDTSALDALLKG
jgi:hypothetical protein